jgi:16S rRNA (cytosine1402-N4)-methyltransferase
MKDECCKYLNIIPGGVYVDCTLGGGGHTKAILQRGGRVIGIDQDPDAIKRSQGILQNYIDSGDCEIVQTNFRNIGLAIQNSRLAGLNTERKGLVDGVLMDLGVSSFQINEASRGFAFGQDGPLDMRMNKGEEKLPADEPARGGTETENEHRQRGAISAHQIINTWDGTAIADVLYNYGDETRSRVLAREIVSSRPLNTTAQLVDVIARKTSFKERSKTLARCFQALRIVVNDEIGALEDALHDMHRFIRQGGAFVVMSYHSLEDRRVKQLFRTGSFDTSALSFDRTRKEARTNHDGGNGNPWESVMKRAVVPTDEEIAVNRRARSAKLRAATQILKHGSEEAAGEEVPFTNADVASARKSKTRTAKAPFMGAKELAKLEKRKLQQDRSAVHS